MNSTLNEGDVLIINKMAYGARLPITPFAFDFNGVSYFENVINLPYVRLPGYDSIKTGDIIVFNLPLEIEKVVDRRIEYVKRCLAIPGDSILIENGKIAVNNKNIADTEGVLYQYNIQYAALDHSIENTEKDADAHFYTALKADSIARNVKGVSVEKQIYSKDFYRPQFFPNSAFIKWNPDNFGPFFLPRKGQQLNLTDKNVVLYGKMIKDNEGAIIEKKGEQFYVNNIPDSIYTFKMNYYFVVGDNRNNSVDSRFWGPVPENHIIGRVSYVLSFLKN